MIRSYAIAAGTLLIAAWLVFVSAARFASAIDERATLQARWKRIRNDATTIAQLRSREERVSLHLRPTEDVAALLHAALTEAGLPDRQLADIRNESDTDLPSSGGVAPRYRQQSLSIALRGLSTTDLGLLLAAWRQVQSAWSITRLTLTHPRGRNEAAEKRYDANLIITAIYLAE